MVWSFLSRMGVRVTLLLLVLVWACSGWTLHLTPAEFECDPEGQVLAPLLDPQLVSGHVDCHTQSTTLPSLLNLEVSKQQNFQLSIQNQGVSVILEDTSVDLVLHLASRQEVDHLRGQLLLSPLSFHERLESDNENEDCILFHTEEYSGLAISLCAATSTGGDTPHNLRARAPPCCMRAPSLGSLDISGTCDCGAENYTISAANINILADAVITANSITLQGGSIVVAIGAQSFTATSAITITGSNFTGDSTGLTMINDVGLFSINVTGPVSLIGISIYSPSILIAGRSVDNNHAVYLNSTTLSWSGDLSMVGRATSNTGIGVFMSGGSLNAGASATLRFDGSSALGSGVYLLSPVYQNIPASTTIVGTTTQTNGVLLEGTFTLYDASITATCTGPSDCFGLNQVDGGVVTLNRTNVFANATGLGPAINLVTTLFDGTCSLVGYHPCTGVRMGVFNTTDATDLTITGMATGNCNTGIGVQLKSPATVRGAVNVTGQVAGGTYAFGLKVEALLTLQPGSTTDWTGTSYATGTSTSGVDIVNGGFHGMSPASATLSGYSYQHIEGVGINLSGPSTLDSLTVRGYVEATNHRELFGVKVTRATQIISVQLQGTVNSTSFTGPGFTMAVFMLSSNVVSSTIGGTVINPISRCRGVYLEGNNFSLAVVSGSVQANSSSSAVYLATTNSFVETTITGTIPTSTATGMDYIYGIELHGIVDCTGDTTFTGSAGLMFPSATVIRGVIAVNTNFTNSNVAIYGTGAGAAESTGIELQNTLFNLTSSVTLVGTGTYGVVFSYNSQMYADTLDYQSTGKNVSTLPTDMTFQLNRGDFYASSDDTVGLAILSRFINPPGCTLTFNATLTGGVGEPIRLDASTTPITLELGSCDVDFRAAVYPAKNLNVTGGSLSVVRFTDLSLLAGRVDFSHDGHTVISNSIDAGDVAWNGNNPTCLLSGTVHASHLTLCDEATVNTNLLVNVDITATLYDIDCVDANPCDLTVQSGSTTTLLRSLGSNYPFDQLSVWATGGIVNTTSDIGINFSNTLFMSGTSIFFTRCTIDGHSTGTQAEFFGDVIANGFLLLTRLQEAFFFDSSVGNIVADDNLTLYGATHDLIGIGQRLQSNQSINTLTVDVGGYVVPFSSFVSTTGSELYVQLMKDTGDITPVYFMVDSANQYSRLIVDDLDSMTDIQFSFMGTFQVGENYHMMAWNSNPASRSLLHCNSPDHINGPSQVAIVDGTLCTTDSTSQQLVAKYNQTVTGMNSGNNRLSFVVDSVPVAAEDYCVVNCFTSTSCQCCVNVLTNDTDPDLPSDSLSAAWKNYTTPVGAIWDLNSNGSICGTVSNLSTGAITTDYEYWAFDSAGAYSDLSAVHFTWIPPTPSVSPSRSPSMSSSSSVSATPTPSVSVSPTSSGSSSITPTSSSSRTGSPSSSSSFSRSPTSSDSSSSSRTGSPSSSSSPSRTPTSSASSSITESPTPSRTSSVTSSPTSSISPSYSSTRTPTSTGSSSSSVTPTASLTPTPTMTRTSTGSSSSSITPTPTSSASSTSTLTASSSSSLTPTGTRTPSSSVTSSPSSSLSASSSSSSSSSPTASASVTGTPSSSASPTSTGTSSSTSTSTSSSSATSSSTATTTASPTSTATASSTTTTTASVTPTPSSSKSGSDSQTPSSSVSPSASRTSTSSDSPSSSVTASSSPTRTTSDSASGTPTPTASTSESSSSSQTPTPTRTPSATSSSSASSSPSRTTSDSASRTPTGTRTPSSTASSSESGSSSRTRSSSSSRTPSPSQTPSSSASRTPTGTSSRTPSPSMTLSSTGSNSFTGTPSISVSPSASVTDSRSSSASPTPSISTSSSLSRSASPSTSSSDMHSDSPRASLDPGNLAGEVSPTTSPRFFPSASSSPRMSNSPSSSIAAVSGAGSTQTLSGCQNCEFQETQVTLSKEDQTVTLSSDDAGPVVTLSIPGSLTAGAEQGQIDVQFARERDPIGDDESVVQSAVVDITLVIDGQVVTQLSEPIEICLTFSDAYEVPPQDSLCLGYFDVSQQEWVCEDLALALNADGQLCGETGHLTSFALLLGGSTGSSGEYFPQSTIAWLSLGFIAGALVIIVLSIGAIEVRFRRKKSTEKKMYRTLDSRIRNLS